MLVCTHHLPLKSHKRCVLLPPAPDAAETKVVRTALAHITNNTVAAQQGAKGHKQAAPSGQHRTAAKGAARQKQQAKAAEQPVRWEGFLH